MTRPSPAPRRGASSHGAAARRGVPAQVRIIGGRWKRTPLPVPEAEGLRPTPDRVRETLFNWLGQRLDGARCLDLFAGSGALGFEAASRGAAEVLLVERNMRVADLLEQTRRKLQADCVKVVAADGLRFAAGLASGSFDLVFLDPPFAGNALLPALRTVLPLLAPDGALYVEMARPLESCLDMTAPPFADWTIDRQGKAGAVHYHLLRHENRQ